MDVLVEFPATTQLPEDGGDATRAVNVLHEVTLRVGRDLGQAGGDAGNGIDVILVEIHPSLLGCGQQMQNSVGGSPHRNIQAHGIAERRFGGD